MAETTSNKELTTKQLKNKCRVLSIILYILSYIALALPYLIILLVNRDKYFVEQNGITLSFGCIMCIVIGFIVIKSNVKILKGLWILIICILAGFFLQPLILDIEWIGLYGLIGYVVFMILNKFAKYYHDLFKNYQVAEINATTYVQTTKK